MAGVQSKVIGFKVNGTSGQTGIGVLVENGPSAGTAIVQNNGISGHDVGVLLTGTTTTTSVTGNSITTNEVNVQAQDSAVATVNSNTIDLGMSGLRVTGSANVMVRFNAVLNSGTQNVEVSSPNADVGRVGSPGANGIQRATGVNIWNRTHTTLQAVGNTLDARDNKQTNTNENDGTQNLANEPPGGCIKLTSGDC